METAGLKRLCVLVGLCASLTSCGGAGDESTDAFSTPLKGGIWHGTGAGGVSIYAIATEEGEFHVLTSDGTNWTSQYAGTMSNEATFVAGSFEAFTFGTTQFADGGTHGFGTFNGRMNPSNSISVNLSLLTDGSTVPLEDSLDMDFDGSYKRPSSFSRIGGSFGAGNDVLQVFSDGTVFAQFPGLGCTVNGTVAVNDPKHNVYSLAFTLAGCTNAAMNGELTGLATLDDSSTPQRLVAALHADGIGLAFTLNRL